MNDEEILFIRWVRKNLKRRVCGESFLRHKGRSEYSSLPLKVQYDFECQNNVMDGEL